MAKYPIVTLCGSTRFKHAFLEVQRRLTLTEHIVLLPGLFSHADGETGPGAEVLEDMHRARIDMSDFVYVVNPGGYIGEGTASEIAYAEAKGKKVYYMCEPQAEMTNMRYQDFKRDTAYRVVAGKNANLCEDDVFAVDSIAGSVILTGKQGGWLDAEEIDEDFFKGLTILPAPEYEVLTSNGSVLLIRRAEKP